jgi:hypothetical protein
MTVEKALNGANSHAKHAKTRAKTRSRGHFDVLVGISL